MKQKLLAARDFLRRTDWLLFFLCLGCAVFGIVILSSVTASYGGSYIYVQTAAMLIGIALFFVFTVIDVDIIAGRWPLIFFLEVVLLLLLIPFGESGDTGNTGWIRFLGIGIQPSEIVKVMFIVLMSKHIAWLKEYKGLDNILSVAQLLAHFGFLFVLIMVVSNDLGSALVFFFIFLILLFAAGLKLYWFLFGAAALAVAVPFAWSNFLTSRQKERILAPYDSTIDPLGLDINWQTSKGKLALAGGRLTGMGFGNGSQTQSDALTSKHADFIFACIGEELGMIGCCIVIALLVAIIIRCVMVGLRSRNTFSMLVCFGVAAMVTFQTFENIGMVLGLTPVIGLTLPFFSYGGSSMFTTFAAMGLVSGVHYKPKPERFRSTYIG